MVCKVYLNKAVKKKTPQNKQKTNSHPPSHFPGFTDWKKSSFLELSYDYFPHIPDRLSIPHLSKKKFLSLDISLISSMILPSHLCWIWIKGEPTSLLLSIKQYLEQCLVYSKCYISFSYYRHHYHHHHHFLFIHSTKFIECLVSMKKHC